ncbi:MAG: alpha/beta hydrolase [Brevibacterium yomogidense]|uniref:Putative esterase/lipase n=1 Tax=Brevibacterium yomogidense TaxID=946573 RepID=A0A1X6XCG8_9MICO|nr:MULTISPECIES: alpha/beta fold hydrolase [Brevibacterium]SLM96931.1 putative esterase/lipase [Brevibacterium yomogidense]SMX66960.1 carboxylesterase [Brevibacterium sp. Mu109]
MASHDTHRQSQTAPDDGISLPPDSPHSAWHQRGSAALPAILLLHGFTGSPSSMRPLAESLSDTSATLSIPRLPGHGGTWQQLRKTGWDQWRQAAIAAYDEAADEHPGVIVVGQSMGGALALALGIDRRPEAIVTVNPALHVDSPLAPALPLLWPFVATIPSIGGDIEKPGVIEGANDRTPVRAVASMHRGLAGLREELWMIDCPVTVCLSGRDGVVSPRSFRTLRSRLSSSARTVALRRSRHVATLDHDADVIAGEIRRALQESAGGAA